MSESVFSLPLSPYPERPDPRNGWADRLYLQLEWPVAAAAHRLLTGRAARRAREAPLPVQEPLIEDPQAARRPSAENAPTVSTAIAARPSSAGWDALHTEELLDRAVACAQSSLGLVVDGATREAARLLIAGHLVESHAIDEGLANGLAGAVAALAGRRVHLLFTSTPRALREHERLAPFLAKLGVSSGTMLASLARAERQAVYRQDIVFAYARDVAFDYLRDRLVLRGRPGPTRLRIEALTLAAPRISEVLLPGLQSAFLIGADSLLVDEVQAPVAISADADTTQEYRLLQEALSVGERLVAGLHYQPVERGLPIINAAGLEVLESIAARASGYWSGSERRAYLMPLVLAVRPLRSGRDYLVANDRVELAPASAEALGLPPAELRMLAAILEAREGVAPLAAHENIARLSMQRFYRRYLGLAGTVGHVGGVRGEIWKVFRRAIVRVPDTARAPRVELELPLLMFASIDLKFEALRQRATTFAALGHAVIIALRTMESIHRLSAQLTGAGIAHRMLAGLQDADEAVVFARAAQQPGIILCVSHVAFGTRIEPAVAGLAGFDILIGELLERRSERAFFARCAAAGGVQSGQVFVSLEDALINECAPSALLAQARANVRHRAEWRDRLLVAGARWQAAALTRRYRRELLRREDYLGDILSFSGASS